MFSIISTRAWMKHTVYGVLFVAISFFHMKAIARDTVLVVDSYHSGYPWVNAYREGLNSVLKESHRISYFELDTKRQPFTKFEERAQKAWEHIAFLEPEHIVLADDNAVRLLGPKLTKANIPFIYLGVNANPRLYGISHNKSTTGVLERLLIKRATLAVNNHFPLKNVLILFDNGVTSRAIFQDAFEGQSKHAYAGISVTINCVSSFKDWMQIVKEAKQSGFDAIFLGLYQSLRDEEGRPVPEEQAIHWLSANTPVPPFALWDYAVGKDKLVGGFVISGFEQGRMAGLQLIESHQNSYESTLPAISYSGTMLFSKKQLNKWNITLEDTSQSEIQYIE